MPGTYSSRLPGRCSGRSSISRGVIVPALAASLLPMLLM